MKAKIRVATDTYEFIELEVEGNEEEIWDTYKSLKAKTIMQSGLSVKEFQAVLDEYLKTGSIKNGSEVYSRMNETQKMVIQEIKKSIKRNHYDERIS